MDVFLVEEWLLHHFSCFELAELQRLPYSCWASFDVKGLLQCLTCFAHCCGAVELEIVFQEAEMMGLQFFWLAPL